ncbi:MAG: hypothetical protein ACRC2K_08865, partial [Clostridium sp.]
DESGSLVRKLKYSTRFTITFNVGDRIQIGSSGSIKSGTISINENGVPLGYIKIRVGVDYINVEKA